ncbi:MAG: hypothetical protein E6J86_04055 [Deltaproteobacteria bacterium]|nr:MAG: hypothetical protein E6J86_04055 [Deltaproteobacteria bacterium]
MVLTQVEKRRARPKKAVDLARVDADQPVDGEWLDEATHGIRPGSRRNWLHDAALAQRGSALQPRAGLWSGQGRNRRQDDDRLSSSTPFEDAGSLRGASQRRVAGFIGEQQHHRPCFRPLDAAEKILPEREEVARISGDVEPRGGPGWDSA